MGSLFASTVLHVEEGTVSRVQCLNSGSRELEILLLGLVSSLYSVYMISAHGMMPSTLETPSGTYPEICLLGDSRFYKAESIMNHSNKQGSGGACL